jgi:valyl-tRNA synthetase
MPPPAPSTPTPPAASPTAADAAAKAYQPAAVEPRITARWESARAFHPDPKRVLSGQAKPYCILIPPPNVTGALHLGHALNNTLQDILTRAHRMKGFETLWMPGTDHAGIATQAVVERRLLKEEGKRRKDFTREQFVEKVQSWKDEYEARITAQLKAMGASCDYERQRFTMDPICARAVREAFFILFRDGLIYRGKRLVNWDPELQTAVADDECYDEEIDSFFYYLRYPLVKGSGGVAEWQSGKVEAHGAPGSTPAHSATQPLRHSATSVSWGDLARRGYPGADTRPADEPAWVTVATTRPETYLGDTAVAINPKDPRAAALRGLMVRLPIVGRVVPILEDDYVVLPAHLWSDPEAAKADPKAQYATGFLKVTPAHDPNDYDLGMRHRAAIEAAGLPVLINVMAPDASISGAHGWSDPAELEAAKALLGLSREAARKKVIELFKGLSIHGGPAPEGAATLLEETRPYRHSVKHSDRTKKIIEPYLSDQWFVRVTDDRLAGAANRALVPDQRTPDTIAQRGAGVPPASERPQAPVSASPGISANFNFHMRRLPHHQIGGKAYFVTFRLASGTLSPEERRLVADACTHFQGERADVILATVMPDHVHIVLRPLEKSPGQWHTLGELMHSIKSFTAHQINKRRGASGPVWQDEHHDRIIRPDEWSDTLTYVWENPVKAGLAERAEDYPFTVGSLREVGGRGAPPTPPPPAAQGGGGVPPATGPLAAPAPPSAPTDGTMRFFPARYAKTYEQWHDNIRDWCISRQLWWGHRIPVWTRTTGFDGFPEATLEDIRERARSRRVYSFPSNPKIKLEEGDTAVFYDVDEPSRTVKTYVCFRSDRAAPIAAFERAGYEQDPDVLDTWFSSALWPLSTMGWPDPAQSPGTDGLLAAFNPTSVLSTAREIITLWVSRMVMMNRYLLPAGGAGHPATQPPSHPATPPAPGSGPPPFRDVFIHAVVQDGEGKKMSKTAGNGVDPLDIIASHGADAMRFTLAHMTTQTQDVRMPVARDPKSGKNTSPKFDAGRNFCNKLWNTARFALDKLPRSAPPGPGGEPAPAGAMTPITRDRLALPDRWILSRLASAVRQIDTLLANYEFADYAEAMYRLLWWDLCDWYLEAVKPTIAQSPAQQAVLAAALRTITRLLHPITPFITEAVHEQLEAAVTAPVAGVTLTPPRTANLLATAGWPILDIALVDAEAESAFEKLREVVTAVRNVRSEHQVPPKRKITLHVSAQAARALAAAPGLVETLAGLDRIETLATPAPPATPRPTGAAVTFRALGEEMLLTNLADAIDAGAERDRLTKHLETLRKSEGALAGRLSNPGYVDKAPAKLVEESKAQLARIREDIAATEAKLGAL